MKTNLAPQLRFDTPKAALTALLEQLRPVGMEQVPLAEASRRVLAEEVLADRDSPACATSAMDGYAVRLADLAAGSLPVAGAVRIGAPAPALPPGAALYIVTGAPVPAGAEAIIRVEDVEREEARIILKIPPATIRLGLDIRRQGENVIKGGVVLRPGAMLTPAAIGAMGAFGFAMPRVYQRVRIGILTTGDEVLDVDSSPLPWQLRNTNAVALYALFAPLRWAQVLPPRHAPDDASAIESQLQNLLEVCDLILLTGGVSMGDRDYVPAVVGRCGAGVVFHKLPIHPGKPILAATGKRGQAILGLPGNPVSVMTTAVRFALPAARHLAGLSEALTALPIRLANPGETRIKLWWSRPVKITENGEAFALDSRGSGDIAGAAASDGFIEMPPDAAGVGPWPFYRWEA